MNKKLLIPSLILILLITAALAYAFLRPRTMTSTEKAMRAESSANTKEPAANTPQTPANTTGGSVANSNTSGSVATPGTYTDYTESAVAQTSGRKLLFFYAPWCPQCRALQKSIQEQGVPDNTTIFKIDYDSATALRQKYGVTIQTTIVEIDDQGQGIKKYVAYDQPNLPAVLKGLE